MLVPLSTHHIQFLCPFVPGAVPPTIYMVDKWLLLEFCIYYHTTCWVTSPLPFASGLMLSTRYQCQHALFSQYMIMETISLVHLSKLYFLTCLILFLHSYPQKVVYQIWPLVGFNDQSTELLSFKSASSSSEEERLPRTPPPFWMGWWIGH